MQRADKIVPDKEKLVILLEGWKETGLRWEKVSSVSFHKLDCRIGLLCYLTFDTDYGEYLEAHDEMEGFDELFSNLSEYLPIIDDGWQRKCESASPDDGPVIIYQRP